MATKDPDGAAAKKAGAAKKRAGAGKKAAGRATKKAGGERAEAAGPAKKAGGEAAEEAGPAKKAARGRAGRGAAEAELLDLARSVIGLAGTEISNRRLAVEDRMDKSRSVLRRAQQYAGAEESRILEEVLERLEADRKDTLRAVDAKTVVLDDLAHDLATVAARFKM